MSGLMFMTFAPEDACREVSCLRASDSSPGGDSVARPYCRMRPWRSILRHTRRHTSAKATRICPGRQKFVALSHLRQDRGPIAVPRATVRRQSGDGPGALGGCVGGLRQSARRFHARRRCAAMVIVPLRQLKERAARRAVLPSCPGAERLHRPSELARAMALARAQVILRRGDRRRWRARPRDRLLSRGGARGAQRRRPREGAGSAAAIPAETPRSSGRTICGRRAPPSTTMR